MELMWTSKALSDVAHLSVAAVAYTRGSVMMLPLLAISAVMAVRMQ
jgi:hypothetical protein